MTARSPARSRRSKTEPAAGGVEGVQIRLMGPAAEVEAAVAALEAAGIGLVVTGRAPMRDRSDGLRVYGALPPTAAG
ncbi:hypothetical protein CRT60_01055 [Azospirillum palustre]|uniref:Uncharacterized protein n=1 Tax=Azospirillum palustre TaxID=2044885 RepID=A0A2B8BNB4_9PROT|nr:hypothetical protein [Azospirillum palustre]PGH59250.1 hypothetical protein CRT60_01055 [Azospirillum palustre]